MITIAEEPKLKLTQTLTIPYRNSNKRLINHLKRAKNGIDRELYIYMKGEIIVNNKIVILDDWHKVSYFETHFEILDLDSDKYIEVKYSDKKYKTYYCIGISE